MFGANTITPNRMLSYRSAHQKWASTAPIRGRQDQNSRPLARRGNDNLTIRQDPTSGDIIVQLYSTDIIRYREREGDGYNNLIELDPYPSVLTNRIMTSILAPHVFTHWSDRSHPAPDYITAVGGRYYNTPSYALIQPAETGWTLVGGEKPFEVPRINRKEAKQALKETGFHVFQTWLNTLIRLDLAPMATHYRRRPYHWSPSEAYRYLTAGEEGWREIAGRMSGRVALDREMTSLRQAVYKYYQCYDTETIPYFESYREMQNAINRMRRLD
jgi:hypothetical protein